MLRRLLVARLVDLAVVLAAVSVIVFAMIRLIPGDAVAIMLGANTEVTPAAIAALRAQIGLDQPIYVQYFGWMSKVLQGDLGTSLWTGKPVAGEILVHVWPTVQLTVLALVLGAGLAVPAGCLMARWRGGAADAAMRVATVAGLTIPSFWLGIVMILVLATVAPSLQLLGYVPFSVDPVGTSRGWRCPPSRSGCRSWPTCRGWCARPCWMRWGRTISARRGRKGCRSGAWCIAMRCATR